MGKEGQLRNNDMEYLDEQTCSPRQSKLPGAWQTRLLPVSHILSTKLVTEGFGLLSGQGGHRLFWEIFMAQGVYSICSAQHVFDRWKAGQGIPVSSVFPWVPPTRPSYYSLPVWSESDSLSCWILLCIHELMLGWAERVSVHVTEMPSMKCQGSPSMLGEMLLWCRILLGLWN